MLPDRETTLRSDPGLTLLDFRVVKFFDFATLKADEVVMVPAFIEFEDGFARLKEMALDKSGLFELGQYAIHGCKADIDSLGQQMTIHVLGGHVPSFGFLEQLKNP